MSIQFKTDSYKQQGDSVFLLFGGFLIRIIQKVIFAHIIKKKKHTNRGDDDLDIFNPRE